MMSSKILDPHRCNVTPKKFKPKASHPKFFNRN